MVSMEARNSEVSKLGSGPEGCRGSGRGWGERELLGMRRRGKGRV